MDKRKNGGKLIAYICCIVLCVTGIGYFALFNSGNKPAKDPVPPQMETTDAPLMPRNEGHGLAMTPADILAATEAEKSEGAPQGNINITVIADKKNADPEAEALRREQEELRRLKAQLDQAALVAPVLIRRVSTPAGNVAVPDMQSGNGSQAVSVSGYDPAADRDKEAFFERADNTRKDGWILPYTREAGRRYELKTGAVIPAMMVSGVNSDLPGSLIAQVSVDVFDSATGKYLLIPRGAKLYGVYDSRVVYGQERVLIAWNRLVFPDGSSLSLGAMPSADISGYAGFKDQVDNHYLRIFGSAVLMSLITGSMSYAVDEASNTDAEGTTLQGEMTAATANTLGQTTLTLLEKNLSIKPTLEIRPGYEFNIVVTKDIIFTGGYNSSR